jgi:acyl-CoA oxidase
MSHTGEELPNIPIYQQELDRSDIDSLQLSHYLHDGKENYERIEGLAKLYLMDPVVRYQYEEYNFTREEKFEEQARKLARLKTVTEQNNLPPIDYMSQSDYGPATNTLMPTSLHHSMFETVLRILGSEEQVTELLPKVLSYEVLGCYAQTELGHGSDVQRLQTEAVFDKETDEFVVDTPSIMAIKFWPGELGGQANHCVFHAKMIVDGESYGIHAFLCRIRDQDSHATLRNLEIGDVGPKYGYADKDNGYMVFKHFRIPRTSLLSRFVSLDKDGKLNIQGDPKVAYTTMLYVRISLVNYTWKLAISICCIAARYTLFRKQFKSMPNSSEERRILDYQATQHQIIPFLCYGYACVGSSKQ